jgi:hypothetical protein
MTCSQCGACCRQIAFGMAYGGDDWNEYYYEHGCRIIPGVGLVVPCVCPHLKQRGNKTYCDIYDNRPKLCRHENKGSKFYKPPGCTE